MSSVVRKATSKDISAIANLLISNWKQSYRGLLPDIFLDKLDLDYGIQKWQSFIAKEDHHIYVAYERDVFLGFGAFYDDSEINNCLYIASLHVSEASRGKGIGTRLIAKIKDDALQNEYNQMSICIITGNDGAKNLYTKLGAQHYKFFVDDIDGTATESEKLVWQSI